jgi:methylenetetrahydrofolate dehydrogenase (NADP+)/methenyltetrahydrofolate cyclohydrolase
LPLPKGIDQDEVLNAISPSKDIDGLHEKTKFMAATARGIKELLEFYKINLANKKVTVITDRNLLFGRRLYCTLRG